MRCNRKTVCLAVAQHEELGFFTGYYQDFAATPQ
jgi:hypothetical protein